jgi:hypothetical protein
MRRFSGWFIMLFLACALGPSRMSQAGSAVTHQSCERWGSGETAQAATALALQSCQRFCADLTEECVKKGGKPVSTGCGETNSFGPSCVPFGGDCYYHAYARGTLSCEIPSDRVTVSFECEGASRDEKAEVALASAIEKCRGACDKKVAECVAAGCETSSQSCAGNVFGPSCDPIWGDCSYQATAKGKVNCKLPDGVPPRP